MLHSDVSAANHLLVCVTETVPLVVRTAIECQEESPTVNHGLSSSIYEHQELPCVVGKEKMLAAIVVLMFDQKK